ncbi:MAG: GGDEF domain-containing protein [Lachnospirales bacterium]
MLIEIFKFMTIVFFVCYITLGWKLVRFKRTERTKLFLFFVVALAGLHFCAYITTVTTNILINHIFYKLTTSFFALLIPMYLLLTLSGVIVDDEFDFDKLPMSSSVIKLGILPAIVYIVVNILSPMAEMLYECDSIFRLTYVNLPIILYVFLIYLYVAIIYVLLKIYKALKVINDNRRYFLIYNFIINIMLLIALSTFAFQSMYKIIIFMIIFLIGTMSYFYEMYQVNNYSHTNAILSTVMGRMQQPFFVCNSKREIVGINDAVKEIIPEFKYSNQYKKKIYDIPSLSSIATEMGRDFSRVKLTIFTDVCIKYLEASISAVYENDVLVGYGIVIYDQTPITVALQKQKRLAEEDYLTGIFNRRTYMKEAETLLSNADESKESFAVFMMDLDNFKRVNDTFSHLAGDEVLVTFAQILKNSQRYKTVMGRYGGEEFSILMTGYTEEEIREYSEKINQLTREKQIDFNGTAIFITVSIGVCFVDYDSQMTFANAIALADDALYQAKTSGKDKYVLVKS